MNIEQQLAEVVSSANALTQVVENKMAQIDQKTEENREKTAEYIANARSEYSSFNDCIWLPEKLVVPALGLTEAEAAAYTYVTAEDYSPKNADNELCVVDIPEFAYFREVHVPNGLHIYIHLLVNVAGDQNHTMKTHVNLLRRSNGSGGYHAHKKPEHPYLARNDAGALYTVEGRNWGDYYIDRNMLKVTGNLHNGPGSSTLRVVNLGERELEIFGIGIEVRK